MENPQPSATIPMATAALPTPVGPNTHSLAVGYLAWFFGFLGLHRFYYGKPVTGTIWFFTGGLFLIGWIVDFFLIPSMDATADRRYFPGRIDYNLAWILLIVPFFGLIGLHRFYMGKIISGIIWLLTGGLLGIGWLYDLWTLNDQISELNAHA
jgi:TM2 domain-containing membrane protein YozV